MKIFYVLCLLLWHFCPGTVHAAVPAKLEKPGFTVALGQHDVLADITVPVFVKKGKHRFVTPAPFERCAQYTVYNYGSFYLYSYLSSYHILLTRLLLFPRHYFW